MADQKTVANKMCMNGVGRTREELMKANSAATRPTQDEVTTFFAKRNGTKHVSFQDFYTATEGMKPEEREIAVLKRCREQNKGWITADKIAAEAEEKKIVLRMTERPEEAPEGEENSENLINGINEEEWHIIDHENAMSKMRVEEDDVAKRRKTTGGMMKEITLFNNELLIDMKWRHWAKTKRTERVNFWNDEWGDYIGLFFLVINKYMTLGEVISMSETNKELEKATKTVRADEKHFQRQKEEEAYQEALETSKPWEVPMKYAGWSEDWKVVFEQERQDKIDDENREAMEFHRDDESGYDSDGHYIPGNWGWGWE